jgi:hypothetical protein
MVTDGGDREACDLFILPWCRLQWQELRVKGMWSERAFLAISDHSLLLLLLQVRHSLMAELMGCFAALLKEYKGEVEDILVADKQVGAQHM